MSVRTTATPVLAAIVLCAGHAAAQGSLRHALEFRASTCTASAQEEPALALAPDGSLTVVWSSRRQQQGRYGAYMQRFDARGVAVGSESPLHLWTRGQASAPVLQFTPDGSAWAAWQSAGQDGWGSAIIARRFQSDFTGSSEILVNQRVEGAQTNPVLAALPDGGAVVAWETSLPGEPQRVAFRVFNADGSARTAELDPGVSPGARTATPSLAPGADGSFALAFAAFRPGDGEPLGVRVRVFAADGSPLGEEHLVSAPGAVTPVEPAIAATRDGFVIAWHDVLEGATSYDVLVSRLDASGAPLGAQAVVNTVRDGLQNGAAVAVAPDGDISIAFNTRDDSGAGVSMRAFDARLRPLGPETALTGRTQGDQAMRESLGTQRLAFAPDGTLLCAWQGDSGFGDSSAANVTLLSQAPIDLGPRTAGITPAMTPASFTGEVALAGGPEPHIPPTFDPRDIDHAEREIIRSRADIGFTGIVNTGWTPPDPHMAVGPNQIVVMTNGAIAFFNKDGTKTFQDEIEDSFGFWGSVGATGFVFDPEVIYDHVSGRFFAMAAEGFEPGSRSHALVAVSDDSDPNGNWFKYRLETTGFAGDLFDSPNIGVTENALIITGDGFGFSANYPVYIFDKASFLVGNPPAITKSFTLTTSTQSAGYPRVTTGTGDTLYLLEHKEAGSGNTQVRVIAFRNILTAPVVSDFNLTVPAYGAPEDPPQKGTASRPNTFDARFWSVDQGPDGHLWGTHHINPAKVVARWYEIDLRGWPTSGNNPTLLQSGDIDLGADIRTFFSSINVADDGTAAVCYARSSPNEFISMGTAYRRPCDPAGQMPTSFIDKSSNAGYTAGRWGDYSAVEFDPAAPRVFWGHHEYAESGSWRTWIQSHTTDTCFCPGDFNHDGVTDTRDVSAFLNAWSAQDPSADWNGDGVINTLDVLAFLNDWTACRP